MSSAKTLDRFHEHEIRVTWNMTWAEFFHYFFPFPVLGGKSAVEAISRDILCLLKWSTYTEFNLSSSQNYIVLRMWNQDSVAFDSCTCFRVGGVNLCGKRICSFPCVFGFKSYREHFKSKILNASGWYEKCIFKIVQGSKPVNMCESWPEHHSTHCTNKCF